MAASGKDINKAKELLEKGQLVAIPTETVYGLAANALDEMAVVRIFEAKNRPQFDPLIIHVPSLEKAKRYVKVFPERAMMLAEAFWPGPLTLLLEKEHIVPDLVTSGMPTVGIRCPRHPLTHALLETLDFPLAAPSANPFGYISPTTPAHVNDQLGAVIPYILDGGPCTIGVESTIIGFPEGVATVYRRGGLKLEEIERVIGPIVLKVNASSNPKTPGQLDSHYAPLKKMITGDLDALIAQYPPDTTGVLSYQRDRHAPHQCILSPSGNLEEAARNLFSALRALDKKPVNLILAEYVPDTDLGRAINDRLRRASGANV